MSRSSMIGRRDFLRGFLHLPSEDNHIPESTSETFDEYSSGPDYLSMLPPEFSGAMLRMEAARLGGDPEGMTQNDMAALVVHAMCGTAPEAVQRQEAHGSAQEEGRDSVD